MILEWIYELRQWKRIAPLLLLVECDRSVVLFSWWSYNSTTDRRMWLRYRYLLPYTSHHTDTMAMVLIRLRLPNTFSSSQPRRWMSVISLSDSDAVDKFRTLHSKSVMYFTASWCPPVREKYWSMLINSAARVVLSYCVTVPSKPRLSEKLCIYFIPYS